MFSGYMVNAGPSGTSLGSDCNPRMQGRTAPFFRRRARGAINAV